MKKKFILMVMLTIAVIISPLKVNASTVDESKVDSDGLVFIGWDPNVEVKVEEGIYYVTLTGDVKQDLIINGDEEVVLDLNGHKFTNFTLSCEALKVLEGGKLTIIDSSGDNSGLVTHQENSTYSVITNLGTLIIKSGSFETTQSFYVIRNEGNMTIDGGTFNSTSTDTSLIGNIKYELEDVTPTMTINNGSFTAISNAIRNNVNSSVTINNGTFVSENAFALDNSATAIVTGGSLTSTNNSAIRNIVNNSNATETSLKVKNATLTSADGKDNYTIYDATLKKDVTDKYEITTDADGNQVVVEKEVEQPNTDDKVTNPNTLDNIYIYVIIGFVALIGITMTIFKLKRFNY